MSEKQDSLRPITASQIAMMEEATATYRASRSLADGWLAARGIASETADTFRLGVVTDPFPGHERMRGYLAIPYLGYGPDGEEQVLSIRFRCLDSVAHLGLRCDELSHGKYQGMAGEHTRMFNVRAIKDADDEIHLTEGELDAVILSQAGFPAVAIPGATNWKRHHTRMLAGFNRIFVWGDPDEAGAKLVTEVLNRLRNAAPVRLTVGDVGETFLAGGYDALDAAREAVKWR